MSIKPELRCVGGTQMRAVGAAENAGGALLPMPVAKAKPVMLDGLATLIAALFDNADDLFFDFAEKVKSDLERNVFFDVMRDLRLQRKRIEQRFLGGVEAQFNCLPNPDSQLNNDRIAMTSLDSLALVENDDLEQTVAVESMVNRARARHADALAAFARRMSAVVVTVQVSERNNPVDPRQLGDAFRKAIKDLNCDIKATLILYKLFEKYVLEALGRVLDEGNQTLIDLGILPDLPSSHSQARAARNTSAAPQAGVPVQSVDPAHRAGGFGTGDMPAADMNAYLQALLASVRQTQQPQLGGFAPAPIGSALSYAREMNNHQLLNMLSDVQRMLPAGTDVVQGEMLLSSLSSQHLRGALLNALDRRQAAHGPERLTQRDTDVIGLVGMLFDFILDDENLPLRVKALVGRLQIPLVKVAVQDASFFSSSLHPARRLLNALARAGIGLPDQADDLTRDAVFAKIQETVQKILDTFQEDATIFDPLLLEFEGFMANESRRSQLMEQRTRSAEEGRALTEQANIAVVTVLNDKLAGRKLPEVFGPLVEDVWSSVLFRIFVKQGQRSREWLAAVQTIDLLIQSVTPAHSAAELSALQSGLPVLQQRLREGFESISYNAVTANELMGRLNEVQQQILRGETPCYLKVEEASPTLGQSVDADSDVIDRDTAAALARQLDEAEGDGAATVGVIGTAADTDTVVASNTAAELPNRSARYAAPQIHRIDQAANFVRMRTEVKSSTAKDLDLPAMAEDDEHWQRASQLGQGAWVEYVDAEGEKIRCKLAARIKVSDRMVFVNRSGMKVRDVSTLEVAHELASCRMVVLDDSLLFDRALQSVIGNLRKVRGGDLQSGL
ncbi:conserved hypothetical protein [gamma proteobacterium HdN1]|nr:conserved hypothetical protein [gamma proteobacterium HdN1]